MSSGSDSDIRNIVKKGRPVKPATSISTRKILKARKPSSSDPDKSKPKKERETWSPIFMTEDVVNAKWKRLSSHKLRNGTSVTTFICNIGRQQCDARLKKTRTDAELTYFSNGKQHSNHPKHAVPSDEEDFHDSFVLNKENEKPPKKKKREASSKLKTKKKDKVRPRKKKSSGEEESPDENDLNRSGMVNMVANMVKTIKHRKRVSILDDETDEEGGLDKHHELHDQDADISGSGSDDKAVESTKSRKRKAKSRSTSVEGDNNREGDSSKHEDENSNRDTSEEMESKAKHTKKSRVQSPEDENKIDEVRQNKSKTKSLNFSDTEEENEEMDDDEIAQP